MDKIKTAVIGMGVMGKRRCEAMKRHGGFEIIATCDVEGSYDYNDWLKCIEDTKPEAVFMCAINSIISETVCYALENGMHVFSEKPPGRNLAETKQMETAYKKSDRVLKFGFNHRYHNSVIEAKTLIDSRLLGDVVCVRGVYGKAGSENFAKEWRNNPDLSGGGILIDQGIHMLDLMLYFIGDLEIKHAETDSLVWRDMLTEDSALAVMRTLDGKLASLHSSALQWKHKFDMDFILTDGYIALNGLLTGTRSYGEERITFYRKDINVKDGKLGNPLENSLCFDEDFSWDLEVSEFYDAVLNKKPIINGTVEDALNVMRLVDSIYKEG